jgi:hypothetical protein
MRPSVLIVAHPGHEVRAFGWYERTRPSLFILTAGSRSGNEGRLWFSARLAARIGAETGGLLGCFRDRQVYDALLARDPTPFLEWSNALAQALVALDPHLVVVDSWQMYNVSHDLVHVMARVAVDHAAKRLGRPIGVVEYDPVPRLLGAALPQGMEAFRIELDDAAFARKRTAAMDCRDLHEELTEVLAVEGVDAQRTEIYRDPVDLDALVPPPDLVPPYERFGAQRVAAGIYRDCILWSEHVRPIVDAIRSIRP